MSNMIKAYTVRYKEEVKKIDVSAKEDEIHSRVADSILETSFVGGLQAITLTEDGEVPAIVDYATVSGEEAVDGELPESVEGLEAVAVEGNPVREAVERTVMSEAYMEAWREAEREKLREEITAAEKLAMKIELEKSIRTQADVILEQTKAQGELLKEKIKQEAEEEKAVVLEEARRAGYEEGRQRLLQEQAEMEAAFAEKERLLEAQYEQRVSGLEPMATEVITKLLEHLSGVCLESRKGIVTYLVTKALSEADRSNSFLIKVSKEDVEEVKGAADDLRALFEREVTLEVVQDALLKKGECMIETDSNIIDCSLGTQLEGLIEDIRLLSVQERM